MDSFFFTAFLVVAASAIDGARGATVLSGTVFCDQCKDGQVSLFDYPLSGMKVTMVCPGSDGQFITWREETTNWLGNYGMRFDGTPNLSGCYTQVSGSNGQVPNGCGATAGPAKSPRLLFNMFDMAMYAVDPLLSQPAAPMPFCPRSAAPTLPPPPPQQSFFPPPPPQQPLFPPPPPQQPFLPPVSRLPPTPPLPFLEASACPHQKWMMPEYRCYWKVVGPDTKVWVVFGLIAARKYGTDISLGQAMIGRGDPYRTLLREGTTSLLNSYNSIQFPFNSISVVEHMNLALTGSTRQVLHTAFTFMKANLGIGSNATCRFTSCK
ncbi:hypothetical protein ABFS83_02G011500 [Erythranthe nasuta]